MSREYKYRYNICDQFAEDLFIRQCEALEKFIPNIKKGQFLHDVYDSKIQYYYIDGKELRVFNDFDFDGLYVESDIELTQFFKQR